MENEIIHFAGVVDDVKDSISEMIKEKTKYSQGSWIEVDVEIKNID